MKFSSVRPARRFFISITERTGLAKSKLRFWTAALAGAVCLCGCGRREAPGYSFADTAMGTVVNMTVYGDFGEEERKALGGELLGEVRRLEEELLSWRLETSELYRVQESREAGGSALSEELYALLQSCQEVSAQSEGAFSVTVGALTRLWNIDALAASGGAEVPGKEAVEAALGTCGPENLRLEGGKLFLAEGTFLDLGAVGKGYALDRLRGLLESREEQVSGVFSLGGSVLTWGSKPGGGAWKVAVADPLCEGNAIGYLELEGTWCVSTSGDYERFFERGGVRYHHLLDPGTGYPARSGLRSVTILSGSGFLSDALSTACFVLGKERGAELAERYGAGILTVDEDGVIGCNAEMENYFHGAR